MSKIAMKMGEAIANNTAIFEPTSAELSSMRLGDPIPYVKRVTVDIAAIIDTHIAPEKLAERLDLDYMIFFRDGFGVRVPVETLTAAIRAYMEEEK